MDVLVPPIISGDLNDGSLETEMEGIVDRTESRYKRLRWASECIVKNAKGLEWVGAPGERMVLMGPPLSSKGKEAEKRRHARRPKVASQRSSESMSL